MTFIGNIDRGMPPRFDPVVVDEEPPEDLDDEDELDE